MIRSHEEYLHARGALGHVEAALAALQRRVGSANPALFAAMAQDYLADIERIRSEIDLFLGAQVARESAAAVWLVLEGARLAGDAISSRILSDWLERFRHGVYRVADYLTTGRVVQRGRPDSLLLAMTDPLVIALQPGSMHIGLNLPASIVQEEMFPEGGDPSTPINRRAVSLLLQTAHWAAMSGDAEIPDSASDRDRLLVVATEVLQLVPSSRGVVQSVRLSGALAPSRDPFRLAPPARVRLQSLIGLLAEFEEATVVGVIREIDLDRSRIILRERGPGVSDMRCSLPDELVSLAESLLDRQVRVEGRISSASPNVIQVTSLMAI